jgi:hypothetical protein
MFDNIIVSDAQSGRNPWVPKPPSPSSLITAIHDRETPGIALNQHPCNRKLLLYMTAIPQVPRIDHALPSEKAIVTPTNGDTYIKQNEMVTPLTH